MSKRLLCVWLPNWPVQRIQAEEPRLAERPLVLSTRDPRRGLMVAANNLNARKAGIRPGMRLAEATALVDAEIVEHDSQEDLETLCSLAEQAQQFSPLVGLEQLDKKTWAGRTLHQPECLLLDVTGLASLFGGEAGLLAKLGQWLYQQRFFGYMGIAGSIGAAWAVANYGTRKKTASVRKLTFAEKNGQPTTASESKPCSIASVEPADKGGEGDGGGSQAEFDYQLPACRFQIVEPRMDRQAVAPLPLSALRQPPETIESLHRLGIYTIEALSSLPRSGMAARLGEQLIQRWDQALGKKREPLITLHASPDWCLEQSLEYPTQHRETMAELVRRLSDELSLRLRRRGEGVLRILCRLDLVKTPPLVLQLALFRPVNDAQHLSVLLNGQLEQQLRSARKASLWRVSLQATLTAPMRWRQTNLFEADEASNHGEVARLVDTLSGRLGRKQVLQAKLRREAQPELVFTMRPLTGRRPNGEQQNKLKKISSRIAEQRIDPSRDDPLRRPSQLFVQPFPISVGQTLAQNTVKSKHHCRERRPPDSQRRPSGSADAAHRPPQRPSSTLTASLGNAVPRSFQYAGTRYDVSSVCGPERLESGWWRGPSVRRDYYRVETKQGSWWWIFRDLKSGDWFLHGSFD